jgi:glycosyltransferase involved in cell wall biosynthesis
LQRRGVAGKLLRSLSGDGIEYAKTLMRWLLGRDKLVSPAYLWKGQRRSIQYILEHASMLLPNSASEYNRLARQYDCEARYTVVPNGIDETIFKNDPSVERGRNLVICAARIEGIKNQLNLIRALNNTAYTLLLIGSPAPNQMEYYRLCRKAAAANVQFIDRITQPELARYYQSAQVHVLPSWFETTGLSSLEAAAAGCSVVITDRGDTREYFGDDAFYCDPADTRSIYDAVNKAAAAKPSETLQQRIAQQFSWRHAAFETLQAYHKVIGK